LASELYKIQFFFKINVTHIFFKKSLEKINFGRRKKVTNLRLKISVDDSPAVHEADGGHELAHDPTGLSLGELVLLADALEQLATFEQLEHQVGVRLVVENLFEPHHVGVALARAQQIHLLRAVDAAADDFDGVLDARLPVSTPSAH